MLKIILNEFKRNGYTTIAEENDIVFLKHNEHDDFWIISQKPFDLSSQSELYEQYISKFATEYPFVKRNTSLIILTFKDALTLEDIVSTENDPYLFKKYVLSYSQDSLEKLKSILFAEDGGFSPIETMMIKPEVFAHLKDEISEGPYHLLYSIAHKLPILPVNVSHEDIIEINLNLDEEQRNCLEWCNRLIEDGVEIKAAIEQFSKE